MALGAGTIIQQPIALLTTMAHDKTLCTIPELTKSLHELKKKGGALHLMGLLSDAGNHADTTIAHALIRCAQEIGIQTIIVHPFLDGRDVPPRSAARYLDQLEKIFTDTDHEYIGSIHGRAYAMDRSDSIEMLNQSLNVLLNNESTTQERDWRSILKESYAQGLSDEYIAPIRLRPEAYIHTNDGIILWNIRADRSRELSRALMAHHEIQPAWILTGIPYYSQSTARHIIELPTAQTTILDRLHAKGYRIGLCAESEKYAHITYFLNGGRDLLTLNYLLIIVPSTAPRVLIDHPTDATRTLTALITASLTTMPQDFYIINYGAPDLLGHTGDIAATTTALAALDDALYTLYSEIVVKQGGSLYIVADHGNAECMYDLTTQQPHTGHTENPVPFIELHPTGQKPFPPVTTITEVAPYILSSL